MQPRRPEGLRPVRVQRAPPLPTPRRSPSVAEVKISDFGLSAELDSTKEMCAASIYEASRSMRTRHLSL